MALGAQTSRNIYSPSMECAQFIKARARKKERERESEGCFVSNDALPKP